MEAGRGEKANMENMEHTDCKARHSHWLLMYTGFWQRTLKQKVDRSLSLTLPYTGGSGRCQDQLDLRSHMLENQFPDAGPHAGMHSSPGASPCNAITQCTPAHGSWTVSTVSP